MERDHSMFKWMMIGYSAAAVLTLFPTLWVMIRGIRLHEGGAGFAESAHFPNHGKELQQHWTRIQGTLRFWKKMATTYMSFHYYCVSWTLISSWLVPLIAIHGGDCDEIRWLIVIVSSHVALALSFYRAFNVGENMKVFRLGESGFYDLYRRLLDRPRELGPDEDSQVGEYYRQVEIIRRQIRKAEIWSSTPGDEFPSIEGRDDRKNGDSAVD
jgi:hypothetical protein